MQSTGAAQGHHRCEQHFLLATKFSLPHFGAANASNAPHCPIPQVLGGAPQADRPSATRGTSSGKPGADLPRPTLSSKLAPALRLSRWSEAFSQSGASTVARASRPLERSPRPFTSPHFRPQGVCDGRSRVRQGGGAREPATLRLQPHGGLPDIVSSAARTTILLVMLHVCEERTISDLSSAA